MSVNGINGGNGLMGPRMSANLSVPRQTPDMSFGARVQAGVNTVGGAVASGMGMAAGMLPGNGSGIVSAAVSSMSLSAQGVTGGASTPYTGILPGTTGGSAGAVSTTGVPSVNTTVGSTGSVGIPGASSGSGSPNYLGGATSSSGSEFNGDLASMFSQQKDLLKLQASMQNESQKYQAISNVLKTRHENAKNAIGNIR